MARQDVCRQVTDAIVAELEKGVAPWVRPWRKIGGKFGGLPYNGASGHEYRGVNVGLLALSAMKRGYMDPRWFTFRQAEKLGAHVRRGEKSATTVFWKMLTVKELDVASGEEFEKNVPLIRTRAVFNAEQCEGIEPLEPRLDEGPVVRHARAAALLEQHRVDVRHGGDEACYVPALDFIRLPRMEAFESEEFYWSVTLHELTHWTGHEARCARDLSGRFGEERYAAEELVAELGSALLCAHVGIDTRLRHPEYIGHWLKVMNADKYAVFTASKLAEQALSYLVDQGPVVPPRSETDEDDGSISET